MNPGEEALSTLLAIPQIVQRIPLSIYNTNVLAQTSRDYLHLIRNSPIFSNIEPTGSSFGENVLLYASLVVIHTNVTSRLHRRRRRSQPAYPSAPSIHQSLTQSSPISLRRVFRTFAQQIAHRGRQNGNPPSNGHETLHPFMINKASYLRY